VVQNLYIKAKSLIQTFRDHLDDDVLLFAFVGSGETQHLPEASYDVFIEVSFLKRLETRETVDLVSSELWLFDLSSLGWSRLAWHRCFVAFIVVADVQVVRDLFEEK